MPTAAAHAVHRQLQASEVLLVVISTAAVHVQLPIHNRFLLCVHVELREHQSLASLLRWYLVWSCTPRHGLQGMQGCCITVHYSVIILCGHCFVTPFCIFHCGPSRTGNNNQIDSGTIARSIHYLVSETSLHSVIRFFRFHPFDHLWQRRAFLNHFVQTIQVRVL